MPIATLANYPAASYEDGLVTGRGHELPHPLSPSQRSAIRRIGRGLLGLNDDVAALFAALVDIYSKAEVDAFLAAAATHDHDTRYDTKAEVTAKITVALAELIGAAPAALDTWAEIVARLNSDQDALAALVSSVAAKAAIAGNHTITGTWGFQNETSFSAGLAASQVKVNGVVVIASSGKVETPTLSLAMAADAGATRGSFTARATGAGDNNLAGMTFYNDAYALKMGVRADGVFGIGGWSRAAWSWYSDAGGNMVAAGNVSAYSDPRLKQDARRIEDPLGILARLDGVTFTWRDGFAHTAVKARRRDVGVLSDQVKAVLPEIVTPSIEIDGERYDTVAYEKLVPVLIEAARSLAATVARLEARLAVLEVA